VDYARFSFHRFNQAIVTHSDPKRELSDPCVPMCEMPPGGLGRKHI
jgi:hypothetical protein